MTLYLRLFSTGLIILFACTFSSAQTRKKPATVTLRDGSSSSGLVIYKNWEESPSSFSYRKNGSNTWLKLDTSNLISLKIEDATTQILFESHRIVVETTRVRSRDIFLERVPSYETRQVILRCLVKGKLSLYNANLGFDTYYLSRENENPFLLIRRTFEENYHLYEDMAFRDQLSDSLKTCLDSSQASKVQYTSRSLTQMAERCNGAKTRFTQQSKNVKTRVGIVGGVNLSTIEYNQSRTASYIRPSNIKLETNPDIMAGIFADIPISKSVRKFSAYFEGTYTRFSGRKDQTFGDLLDHSYKAKFDYLKLTTMVRYTVPNTFVFVNGGITNNVLIASKQTDTYDFYGTFIEKQIYDQLRKHNIGITGGVGINFKNFGIEARYEATNGNSPYPEASNSFRHFYGLLNFSF